MVIVMKLVELFGLLCLRIFGAFVQVFDKAGGNEFVQATKKGAVARSELYKSEREAVRRLHPDDQALMWLADGKLTQARAAKRRYWKNMDPMPFAKLYRELGFSEAALNYEMTVVERMPGYFRNKVREAMANLK